MKFMNQDKVVTIKNWDYCSPIYAWCSAMQNIEKVEDPDKIAHILKKLPFISCFSDLKAADQYRASRKHDLDRLVEDIECLAARNSWMVPYFMVPYFMVPYSILNGRNYEQDELL